ncbi:MAG: hypothetical protein EOP45_21155, partial [Sphingobacteriaceae bacterium]
MLIPYLHILITANLGSIYCVPSTGNKQRSITFAPESSIVRHDTSTPRNIHTHYRKATPYMTNLDHGNIGYPSIESVLSESGTLPDESTPLNSDQNNEDEASCITWLKKLCQKFTTRD